MMMTSTTVSYAYDFVDGMPGAKAPKGGNEGRGSVDGPCCNSSAYGCGSGRGVMGCVSCMLTYVGMGEVKLGRKAQEHLFAAKVTAVPSGMATDPIQTADPDLIVTFAFSIWGK